MRTKKITDLGTPLGTVIKSLGPKGGVLDIANKKAFIVLPLQDELVDQLLERSPKLIKECRQIRARIAKGRFITHDQVKKRLGA